MLAGVERRIRSIARQKYVRKYSTLFWGRAKPDCAGTRLDCNVDRPLQRRLHTGLLGKHVVDQLRGKGVGGVDRLAGQRFNEVRQAQDVAAK